MKTAGARVTIVLLLGLAASAAHAEVYINEIHFDPPGSLDSTSEYIELRGTPSTSLSGDYLILLENENNQFNSGAAGVIDHIFDLGTYSLGTNGFLTMRQKNNPYTAVAPGTTDLVNTSTGFYSAGWGSLPDSTVGASQLGDTGVIENSGFTAMLIHNNGDPTFAPQLGQDLDQNNDGLDAPGSDINNWRSNWTILDAIGIHSESGEAQYGRLYGNINFGPEATTSIEPGATYVGVGFEIEYIGRWGDSTGQTAADWDVSNLTDNPASGYTSGADYRQSGDPHPIGGVFDPNFHLESSHGISFGTPLNRSLGMSNFGAPVYWTGAGTTAWNSTSWANNWKTNSGIATFYGDGIDVTFDNSSSTSADISAGNVSPASVTFDIDAAHNRSVTGTSGIAGAATVLKQGSGTVTMSSVNSYGGVTTVEAGKLILAGAAKAMVPVLNNGGADIKGGMLVLDYATEADPIATVKSLLTTSYAAGSVEYRQVPEFDRQLLAWPGLERQHVDQQD